MMIRTLYELFIHKCCLFVCVCGLLDLRVGAGERTPDPSRKLPQETCSGEQRGSCEGGGDRKPCSPPDHL